MQRKKLLVSLSGSRPPKLSVSITINHLVYFELITVETNSLESFVRSHYPLWIIHNFASKIFFLLWYPIKMASNETYFSLLESIIAEDVDTYVHLIKYIKKVWWISEETCWFIRLCCRNRIIRKYRFVQSGDWRYGKRSP